MLYYKGDHYFHDLSVFTYTSIGNTDNSIITILQAYYNY